ncbi:ferredoxin [Magnetococcus marinus MC-1]|uniref:Ferredoxin n=1 Tax=Magnetococcus marinus (strain ATCC BAA-1437 / JCM 17883 / MC-1) TaxID=156889 RepID=A0LC55_MAGMM|nr:2Fe-2S iron-sulfur cluster-binding protein [Magnetococcus marinus]ABK45548.1 ferredoxin [Magnetococcus marinus MC-1]
MPKVTFLPINETVDVESGQSLMDVAHEHHIPLECACEGSLACSTCHVIVDEAWFDKLEEATEDEDDILDKAFGLTPHSRLGCQIVMTEALDGLVVTIPEYSLNFKVEVKK